MHSDFRRCTGSTAHPLVRFLNDNDMAGFRQYGGPSLWKDRSLGYLYKWEYQLQNLFKRYRFENDLYTTGELERLTNAKFVDHQALLAMPKPTLYVKSRVRPVIMRARALMREWLGQFDLEKVIESCSFGTKSTVGCPLSESYYDVKINRLTGTREHQSFFDGVKDGDSLLAAAVSKFYCTTDQLTQVNVPKSYKILRGITPNTTLGAFYTKGLGLVFEAVCREVGLDISRTQNRHRRYVKRFSKTRTHVTADLSNASNSYTVALLCALLPRKWFKACMFGRIGHLAMGEVDLKLESVMTMGIGFTFPLQTLLFYAILRSIAELTNVKGLISVYGDDLIYPREMHKYVIGIFSDLGFSLNADKTFSETYFRESCGADFFNGIDVRPFQPEGSTLDLKGPNALSFLYKVLNGLRARWTRHEIASTIEFVLRTILQFSPGIHQVPPSFPDTSGVKVSRPISHPLWMKVCATSNFGMCFTHLQVTRGWRAVVCQDIYRWNALRLTPSALGGWRTEYTFDSTLPPAVRKNLEDSALQRRQYCVRDMYRKEHAVFTELAGEEGMQIVWRKQKLSLHKGVKRRKLKPYEVQRSNAETYALSKTETPMWT